MPPNGAFVEREFVAEAFADLFEHANAFGDDFGTDAIARDDGNFCFHLGPSSVALLVGGDRGVLREQEAELIDAVQQAVTRETFERKFHRGAVGQRQRGRLRRRWTPRRPGSPAARRASARRRPPGSRPFLRQLVRKMSANSVLMTAWKPKSCSAQGACSREEPQPMLRPATRMRAPCGLGFVQHEVGLRIAGGVVAPVGEQVFAEARLRSRGQEARRDDLVGVDVGRGQRDRAGTNGLDGRHVVSW